MARYVGKDIARFEDRRFVTGTGTFIADIRLPDLADVCFVRSVWPHARIVAIDADAALATSGVFGVLTARDLAEITLPFTRQFYDVLDPVLKREHGLWIGPYRAPVLAEDRCP